MEVPLSTSTYKTHKWEMMTFSKECRIFSPEANQEPSFTFYIKIRIDLIVMKEIGTEKPSLQALSTLLSQLFCVFSEHTAKTVVGVKRVEV